MSGNLNDFAPYHLARVRIGGPKVDASGHRKDRGCQRATSTAYRPATRHFGFHCIPSPFGPAHYKAGPRRCCRYSIEIIKTYRRTRETRFRPEKLQRLSYFSLRRSWEKKTQRRVSILDLPLLKGELLQHYA